MKYLAMIAVSACVGCASSDSLSPESPSSSNFQLGEEVPRLFKIREFSSASLAEAANYYIALGEDRAIAELKSLEVDFGESVNRGVDQNERIGWVCRIVFEGTNGRPLRQPHYGGLSIPYLTMPLERWSLYPVAESDGVFFVLSEGYWLAGYAEPASDYIDYCSANGHFRKTKVNEPTHDEAVGAFDSLKRSKRWTMIEWEYQGLSEELALRDIEAQATSIERK